MKPETTLQTGRVDLAAIRHFESFLSISSQPLTTQ